MSVPATLLVPALRVERDGRHLMFTVAVRNTGSAPADLTFSDSGLLQIVATRPKGDVIYDSRAGRMFAQVMKTVTIGAGESTTFSQAWDVPADVHGRVNVRAVLRSNPPLSVTSTIELD